MNSSKVELLTPSEKANLSRKLIFKWYRNKRKLKLDALKKIVLSGKTAEIQRLKTIIIANTKKELAKLHVKITKKQLNSFAKEFAESIMKLGRGSMTIEKLASKFASLKSSISSKELLVESWTKMKGEAVKGNVSEVAIDLLNKLKGERPMLRREAFLMVSLIEKYWNKRTAKNKVYWFLKGGKKLSILRSGFTRDNALRKKIGFYYGTNKIKWYPNISWTEVLNKDEKKVESTSWAVRKIFHAIKGVDSMTLKITGWWTVDINNKGKTYRGGKSYEGILSKLNNLEGDEFSGETNLSNALAHIKKELNIAKGQKGYNDSGLTPQQEQDMIKYLNDHNDFIRSADPDTFKKDLFNWFAKNAKNKWVPIDSNQLGKLIYLYGQGWGKNFFRYIPKQNRVYWLKMANAKNPNNDFESGYISVNKKTKRLVKYHWKKASHKPKEFLKREIVEKMTSKELKDEGFQHRLKYEKIISKPLALEITKGMCILVASKLKNAVKYDNLDSGYLEKLKTGLTNLIKKKHKFNQEKADSVAVYRIEYVKNEISKHINSDELLQEILEENPEGRLKINISSNDKITVKLADAKLRRKLYKRRKRLDMAGVATAAGSAEEALQRFRDKVGNPVLLWILEKVFNMEKRIKDYYSGKSSWLTKILFGIVGMGGILKGKRMIGSKKVAQEDIDRLIKGKRTTKTLRYKLFFRSSVTLKKKKIIIPRGRGIIPGGSMKIFIKGNKRMLIKPGKIEKKGKKPKFNLMSIFQRKNKKIEKLYKDERIIIKDGTRIPKGTIIPRGAKIIKIK